MRFTGSFTSLAVMVTLVACGTDTGQVPSAPSIGSAAIQAGRSEFQWAEPVWLGPVVNSPARELNPELSPDGLALYFTSDRDGQIHIYVSRRGAPNCPWGPPVKLGAEINGPQPNFSPNFSPDGLTLFFARGDHSGQTIYMSRRDDPNDDFGWGPPVKLGPEVNAPGNNHSPTFVQAGGGELYFNRGLPPNTKVWVVPMTVEGQVLGEARLVSEINHPTATSGAVTVRRDGRELFFWSGGAVERPGSIGSADLFVSVRQNVNEPWSEPVGLGRPLNSELPDVEPGLSADGHTIVISTQRPGGLGRPDLWMSVRSPNGEKLAVLPDGSACPAP